MSFHELVQPEIKKVEEYIASVLEPEPKEIYGMLPQYIMRGGKRIRPILATLCCKAVGGNQEEVIKPAGIIEMFHNFTLIHDDIADSSQFRRGEPTLHISHGIPIALNSGDALYTLLWKEMVNLDLETKKLAWLQKRCVETFKAVAEGQGMELSWEREKRFNISEKEYLLMISGKTASLLSLSCEIGAVLGGADDSVCRDLRRFGNSIGVAFQIQDDILNVTGDFKKYKKEIGGDITEGKRTLMIIHCLKYCEKHERERIIEVLENHRSEKQEVDFVIDVLNKSGSVEYARKQAVGLVENAKSCLGKLDDSKERDALLEICDYVVSRET